MNRCSIIIPAFNHAELTRQCLDALGDVPAEIIVVDDGSTEPFSSTLRHETNTGFATACNDGAAVASGEYLIFLNNDTIPQPGWLDALVRYADTHPRAAVVGVKLLFPNNTIQHAGVAVCQDGCPRHIYKGFPADHPAVNKSRRFQIVTAACALVRRAAFKQVGGFDNAYRNGFEDLELCLRLGELGHEIHYCHESVVVHLESVSEGRKKHEPDNLRLFRSRWATRLVPDDLRYYGEDGLLQMHYEGKFQLRLTVAPLLARVEGNESETERLLEQRTREMHTLLRENVRLSTELARVAADAPALRYQQLARQIREAVGKATPAGATVLVVSKGDESLVDIDQRIGWHFPQTNGVFAGHYPADSAEAIGQLETLRAKGAGFLVIPAPSLWWLEHYRQFAEHLRGRYRVVAEQTDGWLIVDLR